MRAVSSEALQGFLSELDTRLRDRTDCDTPAQYTPEMSDVAVEQFAISVALPAGQVVSAGQRGTRFSIQSVSKVFTLACVLGRIWEQL